MLAPTNRNLERFQCCASLCRRDTFSKGAGATSTTFHDWYVAHRYTLDISLIRRRDPGGMRLKKLKRASSGREGITGHRERWLQILWNDRQYFRLQHISSACAVQYVQLLSIYRQMAAYVVVVKVELLLPASDFIRRHVMAIVLDAAEELLPS